MLRSILSVATGIVVWGVLWVAANLGLTSALPDRFDVNGVTKDPSLLAAFIVICAGLSMLAGWLCAAIAKDSLMKHVAVLAVIQLVIGVAVQASVWDLMPVWYHLTFLGPVVPMHLVGGRIRVVQKRTAPVLDRMAERRA